MSEESTPEIPNYDNDPVTEEIDPSPRIQTNEENDSSHSIHGVEAVPSTKHQQQPTPEATEEKYDKDPAVDDEQQRRSTSVPQNNFFSFYKDDNGEPTIENPSRPASDPSPTVSDAKVEAGDPSASITVETTASRSSAHAADLFRERDATASSDLFEDGKEDEDGGDDPEDVLTMTVFCCLCAAVLLLIALGLYYQYNSTGWTPDSQGLSRDASYPECNAREFEARIEPQISSVVENWNKDQNEGLDSKHNPDGVGAYDLNMDRRIMANVMRQIQDEAKELVLLYGAIERHKGTLRLFSAINQQLTERYDERPRTWIYDLFDLETNGTVHERIMCLFERADQWAKEHPAQRLLVVLDHISHYFQEKATVKDRGVVWNQLSSLSLWKRSSKWTLFVVESDPMAMAVGNQDYAQHIFKDNKKARTICIPFAGGYFFERVLRTLTTSNPQRIRMEFGPQKEDENQKGDGTQKADGKQKGDGTQKGGVDRESEWTKLETKMRAFTLDDTFDLYHEDFRTKVLEKAQKNTPGTPVVLNFDEILMLASEHDIHFQDHTVQRMETFASSFGQSIYVNGQMAPLKAPKRKGDAAMAYPRSAKDEFGVRERATDWDGKPVRSEQLNKDQVAKVVPVDENSRKQPAPKEGDSGSAASAKQPEDDEAKEGEKEKEGEKQKEGEKEKEGDKEKEAKKTKLKGTLIYVLMTIAFILLGLLTLWSCNYFFTDY